jgi:hypothetical protein
MLIFLCSLQWIVHYMVCSLYRDSTVIAIQHGNAANIRGTFPDSALLSEMFVL